MDVKQILDDLANVDKAQLVPVQRFNDDDWYLYETDSLMLVNRFSGKTWKRNEIVAEPGVSVERGLTAKFRGLWEIVK